MEAIAPMHVPLERHLEHSNVAYVCFVDYEKAFDKKCHNHVEWELFIIFVFA